MSHFSAEQRARGASSPDLEGSQSEKGQMARARHGPTHDEAEDLSKQLCTFAYYTGTCGVLGERETHALSLIHI